MGRTLKEQAERVQKSLNPKHARQSDRRARLDRFLACFVLRTDFDATQAAIDAGITPKNASAWVWEAWRDPYFQEKLKAHRERQEEVAKLAAVEVAKLLWIRANTSINDLATPDALYAAGVKPDLDPNKAACIKSISSSDASDKIGASRRIEMVPSHSWTDQLGKFLGMFNSKLEVSGKLDWGAAVANMPPPTPDELRFVIEQKQKELAQLEQQKIAEDTGEY